MQLIIFTHYGTFSTAPVQEITKKTVKKIVKKTKRTDEQVVQKTEGTPLKRTLMLTNIYML